MVIAGPAIPCTLLTASSSTLVGVLYRPPPIDALNVLKGTLGVLAGPSSDLLSHPNLHLAAHARLLSS